MKKIVNINIGGLSFIINEDAYLLLNDYLETLDSVFKGNQESAFIEEDIEARISELLTEQYPENNHILTEEDIRAVISRIGEPDTFIENDSTLNLSDGTEETVSFSEHTGSNTPPPFVKEEITLNKRLFRDPKEKILGGVCSGIAHYLGVDPVWIRIIAVLLGFCSFSTLFILYIILWVIIPPASTPFERMQMYGKTTTVKDIGIAVTEFFNNIGNSTRETVVPNNQKRTWLNKFLSFLGAVGKILLLIIAVAAVPIAISLAVLLAIDIIALILYPFNPVFLDYLTNYFGYNDLPGVTIFYQCLIFGLVLTVGIPTLAVIKCALSLNSSKPIFSRRSGITLIITWSVGIVMLLGLWGFSYAHPEYNNRREPITTEINIR
ncbi:MAG: PspC domain-containing protein [Muribaculaceae bacterium]|nr:PspC domain-containing protein [Muribaculaceae bacterium]